ncbi:unnamed protein product [Amoebophrya sp. A120]|nr:unnamed protein product [Amoebophrya sp. A120]|eukprot:GSA120T00013017001.1
MRFSSFVAASALCRSGSFVAAAEPALKIEKNVVDESAAVATDQKMVPGNDFTVSLAKWLGVDESVVLERATASPEFEKKFLRRNGETSPNSSAKEPHDERDGNRSTSNSIDTAPVFVPPKYELIDLLSEYKKNNPEKHEQQRLSGNTPVVFMHGMGDAGYNPGMQHLCKTTAEKYNTYVLCLDVADGFSSITTKMDDQLLAFADTVLKDSNLSDGFSLMGNSQGGLLSRAFIERFNNPVVKRFVSLSGTQNGISTCPTSLSWVCPIYTHVVDPYNSPLVFADYWKDPLDERKYLKESRFLADIGNDREKKNVNYAANMKKLEKYVMIETTKDSMVLPHESEAHGYYAWGGREKVEELRETVAYKEDWIGLRTLDEAGKLVHLKYPGDHMRIPHDMLYDEVLPILVGKEGNKRSSQAPSVEVYQ